MLIAFSGVMGSGKDTAGTWLSKEEGFRVDHFAKTIKDMTLLAFPKWDHRHVHGELKNLVCPYYGVSPRDAMQKLGTEWGRDLHPDLWVLSTLDRIDNYMYKRACICDVRFPNEVKGLQRRGGFVIRLLRGEDEVRHRLRRGEKIHPSETALLDYKGFDFVLDNTGTLETLYTSLRHVLSLVR